MPRLICPAIRTAMTALSVAASAGVTLAQPATTAPPPRPSTALPAPTAVPSTTPPQLVPMGVPSTVPPEPVPMGWSAYPSPGAAFVAYPGLPAFYYPAYGYGYGALPARVVYGPAVSPVAYGSVPTAPVYGSGYLPSRAAYGPSVSPLEYPYTGFVPGYPYPGYAALTPYPRTVSSYSSGPSVSPLYGPVTAPRHWAR